MNKYKLNFLRWLTKGELPDKELKTITNLKITNEGFKFRFKANINTKDWKWITGSAK